MRGTKFVQAQIPASLEAMAAALTASTMQELLCQVQVRGEALQNLTKKLSQTIVQTRLCEWSSMPIFCSKELEGDSIHCHPSRTQAYTHVGSGALCPCEVSADPWGGGMHDRLVVGEGWFVSNARWSARVN